MGKIAPKKTKLCSKCPAETLELELPKFVFKKTKDTKKTTIVKTVDTKKKKTKGGLF